MKPVRDVQEFALTSYDLNEAVLDWLIRKGKTPPGSAYVEFKTVQVAENTMAGYVKIGPPRGSKTD